MKVNRNVIYLLGGLVVVAGVGAVVSARMSKSPDPDKDPIGAARAKVRRHMTVHPDCERIVFTGQEKDYKRDLQDYFRVILPLAEQAGATTNDELATFALQQLIPECPVVREEVLKRPDLAILFVVIRGQINTFLQGGDLDQQAVEGQRQAHFVQIDKKKATFDSSPPIKTTKLQS